MACRVLPGLTLAAAVRANAGGPDARWLPPGWPAPRTLLPMSQRSRLAADIAADAGALLPHPFTPYQHRLAGLLSVAVLRHRQFTPSVPPLTVSRGGLPQVSLWARSREVPLKGSGAFQRRRGCARAGDATIRLRPLLLSPECIIPFCKSLCKAGNCSEVGEGSLAKAQRRKDLGRTGTTNSTKSTKRIIHCLCHLCFPVCASNAYLKGYLLLRYAMLTACQA
jgi:hypothetical protein